MIRLCSQNSGFCDEHALILYVYLTNEDAAGPESVITYYISSYSQ